MATAHYTRFDSRSPSFQQLPKCVPGQAARHDAWARIQPASSILEKPYTGVVYHAARELHK